MSRDLDDSPHMDLGGQGANPRELAPHHLSRYLPEFFERIRLSFPRFVEPETPEARRDWIFHLEPFTRDELFFAVTLLVGERAAKPTAPSLKDAAQRARAEFLARREAAARRTGPAPRVPTRLDVLGAHAYEQLGSWWLVSEVWALLQRTAPSREAGDALRTGDVSTEVFDEAVAAVKAIEERKALEAADVANDTTTTECSP